MSLEKHGIYNDLSKELREKLESKVNSFGKTVRFQFNISNPNPDPEKTEGATLWPMMYTLDPLTFSIVEEDKKSGKRSVKIGLVKTTDQDGKPTHFSRIQVFRKAKGVLELYLDTPEDRYKAMYLLLHPKTEGGFFTDKNRNPIVSLIDERKLATQKSEERSLKLKAMTDAQSMSEAEVEKFARAMTWDISEGLEVLKSRVEDLAEYEPAYFLELRDEDGSQVINFLSDVQSALDKRIIEYDPMGNKYVWASNKHTITVLNPDGTQTEKEKFAEWLQHGDDKAKEAYKRIKTLVK